MDNTTPTLLQWAEASRLSQLSDEELYAQEFDQDPNPEQLEDVETDLYTREMLPQIPISEAVRKECEQDMRDGQRNGWRINR